MKKFIYGFICVTGLFLMGGSKANAQVSWVWPDQFPSVCYDANSFTAWLNGVRASYGLPQVYYDASLDPHSHYNNILQMSNGMGHYWFGPARRQNASAVPDFGKVGPCWLTSPDHRAALLDPNIRFISIMKYGIYTTFSAY